MPAYPGTAAEILTATAEFYRDATASCRSALAIVATCGDAVHVTVIAEALRELAIALDAARITPQQAAALMAEGERLGYERAQAEFERPALRLLSAG
jgi:hypothetical protein